MLFRIKNLLNKAIRIFKRHKEDLELDESEDDLDESPYLNLDKEIEETSSKEHLEEKPYKRDYSRHVRHTRELNDEELEQHKTRLDKKIFKKGLNIYNGNNLEQVSENINSAQLIRNLDILVDSDYAKYAMGGASANYIVHQLLKRSSKLKEKAMDSGPYFKTKYYNLSQEFEKAARQIARYNLLIEEHYFSARFSEDIKQADDLARSWAQEIKPAKERKLAELLTS